jgi:hypothetical protein
MKVIANSGLKVITRQATGQRLSNTHYFSELRLEIVTDTQCEGVGWIWMDSVHL